MGLLVMKWSSQWIFTDGGSHIVFIFVLGMMMYLWNPSPKTQQYAYSEQISQGGGMVSNGVVLGKELGSVENWFEEGVDDKEDPESFWNQTQDASGRHADKSG